MSCTTCAHCDTEEAGMVARANGVQHYSAGYCTAGRSWFSGKRVPLWLKGCPDWERLVRSQPLTKQEKLEGLADQGIDTLEDYRMEK